MATRRQQQSPASRRTVQCERSRGNPELRTSVEQWRFELFRQWRFTELPVSSAELPKCAVVRPVFLAQQLLGPARRRSFGVKVVRSSKPELFRSAIVFRPAQFRRQRSFRAEIVLGLADTEVAIGSGETAGVGTAPINASVTFSAFSVS